MVTLFFVCDDELSFLFFEIYIGYTTNLMATLILIIFRETSLAQISSLYHFCILVSLRQGRPAARQVAQNVDVHGQS